MRAQPLHSQEAINQQKYGVVADEAQHGRLTRPEDANADFASGVSDSELLAWLRGAPNLLDPIVTRDAKIDLILADYSAISNIQYFRVASDQIGSLGGNDQKGQLLSLAGWEAGLKVMGANAFATPNFFLGLAIEWSIPKQYAQAFDMRVYTVGFKNFTGRSVDRDVTIKLNAAGASSDVGGILYLPFANRDDSRTTIGYDPTHYSGQAAMQTAIVMPAYLPSILFGGEAIDVDYINSMLVNPDVRIKTTSAVEAQLSVTVRPVTCASPGLADLRQLLDS